jgi:GNAT superfamily N-acetyltransferase
MLKILDRPWSHPDSERLRALQRAELAAIYGRPDSEPGTPPSADDISVFVVAYLVRSPSETEHEGDGDGGMVPIACGALRVLPAETSETGPETKAELKRMFTHADYRGKPWNAATAVLAALEERARANGWMELVLETGELQRAAIKFYAREGYVQIPRFGAYVDAVTSLCFGRVLKD